eukprot:RCo044498
MDTLSNGIKGSLVSEKEELSLFDPKLFAEEEELITEEHCFGHCRVTISRRGSEWQHTQLTALVLWPAAEVLCHHLVNLSEQFRGMRVVELGTGVGLCGIVLRASSKASLVVLTDGDGESVALAQSNILRNNFTPESCRCCRLGWDAADPVVELATELSAPAAEPFNVVIASDCMYSSSSLQPFFSCAAKLLHGSPDPLLIQAFRVRSFTTAEQIQLCAHSAGFEEAGHVLQGKPDDPSAVHLVSYRLARAEVA